MGLLRGAVGCVVFEDEEVDEGMGIRSSGSPWEYI